MWMPLSIQTEDLEQYSVMQTTSSCYILFVQDARDGLVLASKVGRNNQVVEADCMKLIQVMQSGGNTLRRRQLFFLGMHLFMSQFQYC